MRLYSTSIRFAAFAAIVATAPLLISVSANAASESYCNWYATKAVAAYNKAKSKKCGYSGPAWHGWWDGHKGWCLATPKGIVKAGHDGREAKLKKCIGNAGGGGANNIVCKIQKSSGFGQTKNKAHDASLVKNGKHIFSVEGCNAVGTTYLDRSCAKIVGRGWSCTARYRCCKK